MKEAIVAIIQRSKRMLVIQRGPGSMLSGYWSPPSGRIEPGETQEQTVIREMREELGLKVRPIAKVWECKTDDGDYLLHWWTVEEDGDELRPDPNEVGGVVWVNTEEFLKLSPTFRGDQQFFMTVFSILSNSM